MKVEHDTYFFTGRMSDIEEKMDKYGFARCHNAFVVNMRHISSISNYNVILDNEDNIPLAQRKASVFRKRLNAYLHKITGKGNR